MRTRANLIAARFAIGAAPGGRGTRVTIAYPLAPAPVAAPVAAPAPETAGAMP
jgi:hypothetical protein